MTKHDFHFSYHVLERIAHRPYSSEERVFITLAFGEYIESYDGSFNVILTDRALLEAPEFVARQSDELRGLRVVLMNNVIITVMRDFKIANRPGIARKQCLKQPLLHLNERRAKRRVEKAQLRTYCA